MGHEIAKGVALLEEVPGEGAPAGKGTLVTYNARVFLRRGDEVTRDAELISRAREHLQIRLVDGIELIDHVIELGKRQCIAGVEKALHGMRTGGHRKVLVSPHLAYGEKGVADLIPANALLRIHLWVQDVRRSAG